MTVAWSVHNDGRMEGSGARIPYPIVYINLPPSVWDVDGSNAIMPVDGTYYMEIIGELDCMVPSTMDMRLMLNEQVILARVVFGHPSFYVSRGRSIIVHLTAGSMLTVAYENSQVGGGTKSGLSFMGFLLMPDVVPTSAS